MSDSNRRVEIFEPLDIAISNKGCRNAYVNAHCPCPEARCWAEEQKARQREGKRPYSIEGWWREDLKLEPPGPMPDLTDQQRAVSDAFRELLHTRDWLCLQLARASDVMDEKEFDERVAPFWKRLENRRELAEARVMAHHLFDAGVHDIDAEELSLILHCTVRTANEIIQEIAES